MAEVVSITSTVLENALRDWWAEECEDWDEVVAQADSQALADSASLWEDMPEVDSKAIARSSPIFERHLGVPLDIDLIRPGGYESIEDAIADLVPKMIEATND